MIDTLTLILGLVRLAGTVGLLVLAAIGALTLYRDVWRS